jgi:GTPase SAR1 family protein
MGLCTSADAKLTPEQKEALKQERMISKQIEKKVDSDLRNDLEVYKLLLLGAGESGKSTLFKQMITIYGAGYTERDRRNFIAPIHNNTLTAMQSLINASAKHGSPVQCTAALEFVLQMGSEDAITPQNAGYFKELWADSGIQKTYENRASFQLIDSAAFFFSQLDTLASPDFLPTLQDVMRVRVRTTGIVEMDFIIDNNKFKMFDVGGQRNERKKWIHCFENVTAVLFIGVLSEYDLTLFEDGTMNRMEETLNIFDEICNSQWFCKTSIILFLNKRDVFEEKIKTVNLQVCPVFKDYEGEQTFEAGCALIESKFQAKNRNPEKMIYTHVTCATDTKTMKVVLSVVKDIIVRASLGRAGFV